MSITLCQFEKIDALYSTVIRAGDFRDDMTRDEALALHRMQWALEDALIDAIGYASVATFSSIDECAATLIAGCLSGSVEILDEMEDA